MGWGWILKAVDTFNTQAGGADTSTIEGGMDAGSGAGLQDGAGNMGDSAMGGGLKEFMGYNEDSEILGNAALDTANETEGNEGLSKFQDYVNRYQKGKDSNLLQFGKDVKDQNYMGALGYASKLANDSKQGAQPTPLIQLDGGGQQQPPIDDRYGQMYQRYRGY